MEIKLCFPAEKTVADLAWLLHKKIQRSRFTVGGYRTGGIETFEPGYHSRHGKMRIHNIRLKRNKPYHGPSPTPRRPMKRTPWGRRGNEKIARMGFLEGADWVEFNDLLNDFCDEQGLCANVFSSVCMIRRGWFRRISYNVVNEKGHMIWERFAPPEHYMAMDSRTGPFPMSAFYSTGANSIHRAPTGLYRNMYMRWSVALEDIHQESLLTSLIESGELESMQEAAEQKVISPNSF